jgi:hypothetical protein
MLGVKLNYVKFILFLFFNMYFKFFMEEVVGLPEEIVIILPEQDQNLIKSLALEYTKNRA